jgi:hypothetical protein
MISSPAAFVSAAVTDIAGGGPAWDTGANPNAIHNTMIKAIAFLLFFI